MIGNIGFENPGFLWALILLLPSGLFYLLRFYQSRGIFAFFAASSGEAGTLRVRYFFSYALFLVFLACLFFALAGPRWGSRITTEYRREVDLIFAVDLSRSMEVRDGLSPAGLSRLEQARRTMELLVSALGENAPGKYRFGLVFGKDRGILALPLSYDTEAVLALLGALEGGLVSGGGTNLGSLIDTASGAFQDALPSRRVIVLFSDGEDLAGSFSAALERAVKGDIMVIPLGLGSETGGPVPLGESLPGSEGPGDILLDERGLPVISYRRTAFLRNVAEHTGGIYLDGNREDSALLLAEHIRSLSVETGGGLSRQEPQPRWRLFVLGGLLALALSRLFGLKQRFSGNLEEKRNG
ncbi:MAG: VWA domain-containing protein [Treponema sp.]|jgi:Ca-activated chloride channel family protein|nr:VWA domain-containing protein [Treponema sp.]